MFLYEHHTRDIQSIFSIGCHTRLFIGAYSLIPNSSLSVTGVHHNEWNLTVRRRGSLNYRIFVVKLQIYLYN